MAQKMLHRRRRAEDQRRAHFDAQVRQDMDIVRVASWENQTNKMIQARLRREEIRCTDQVREDDLNTRRKRLADMLDREFHELQAELRSSFETMEQRRERMVREASKLQEDRERQRQAEVRRLREIQWKESVDEIRTHQSKLLTSKIAEDRITQLRERNLRMREEAEEENRLAQMWDARRGKLLEREIAEAKDLRRRNKEMRQILDHQVSERERILDDEENQLIEEAEDMKAKWKADAEDALAREIARRERAAQIERDVQAFNQHKNAIDSKIVEKEKALDARLLKAALENEAEEIRREIELKKQRKAEMIAYQKALQEQMVKEAEDNAYLEKLLKEESDKEWDKREARWNAEARARANLMKDVDRSRKMQLQEKAKRKVEEVAADRMWAEKARKDLDDAIVEEARKSEQERQQRFRDRDFLLDQIDRRKQARREALERQLHDLKLEKDAERAYQKRFDELFDNVTAPAQDFRRKKVQWYY
eukprot:g5426.t1